MLIYIPSMAEIVLLIVSMNVSDEILALFLCVYESQFWLFIEMNNYSRSVPKILTWHSFDNFSSNWISSLLDL